MNGLDFEVLTAPGGGGAGAGLAGLYANSSDEIVIAKGGRSTTAPANFRPFPQEIAAPYQVNAAFWNIAAIDFIDAGDGGSAIAAYDLSTYAGGLSRAGGNREGNTGGNPGANGTSSSDYQGGAGGGGGGASPYGDGGDGGNGGNGASSGNTPGGTVTSPSAPAYGVGGGGGGGGGAGTTGENGSGGGDGMTGQAILTFIMGQGGVGI